MVESMGRRRLRGVFALAIVVAILFGSASPAAAHVQVLVGGVVGFPAYSAYPYQYVSPYPYPYWAPYPYVEDVPPPGWVAGHWEVRSDPWGRAVRVWVPGHLR